MNLREIGASCDTNNPPPECVLTEPIEPYLPNWRDYSTVGQALWFDSGPANNPTARSYVFYFFKGGVDEQRRPDEILTFKVKLDNPYKVYIVDNYLGGMAFGAVNAPALAHRNMWRPGLMSQEGKQQYQETITSSSETASEEKKGCFIATSVYGNSATPEVMSLRRYRDDVLLHSICGRFFVTTYYAISPCFAAITDRSPLLRRITKQFFLDPLVRVLRKCTQ